MTKAMAVSPTLQKAQAKINELNKILADHVK